LVVLIGGFVVSPKRLISLPDIESLRRISQSLAVLDAILSPEWESRYYSFNSKWSKGEMMASIRNGSGDEYFILFNPCGAIIKGFAHEALMSPYATKSSIPWAGVLDSVPNEFKGFLSEPAFSIGSTTFCVWRKYTDSSWQVGNIDYPLGDDPDGSEDLLSILDEQPSTYKDFAEHYYERQVVLFAVEHIYQHKALTSEIVAALNSDVSLDKLKLDVEEIGYSS
jgi:hypothetical protein